EGLGAVVVLTPAGEAKLAAQGAFRFSRALRRAAAERLEPAERPKYWRFVADLPSDAQGKRTLSALRALFDKADPLRPLELDVRNNSGAEAEIAFTLAPELAFFEGHFPERPILPGLAQVHIATLLAQRLWGASPSSSNLARVKFRRILVPHDAVVL